MDNFFDNPIYKVLFVIDILSYRYWKFLFLRDFFSLDIKIDILIQVNGNFQYIQVVYLLNLKDFWHPIFSHMKDFHI